MRKSTLLITLVLLSALLALPLSQPAYAQDADETEEPDETISEPDAGAELPLPLGGCQTTGTIVSSFNGTPLAAGNIVWFNSHLKLGGLKDREAIVYVRDAAIEFTANGITYYLPLEPSEIHFAPSTHYSYTVYDVVDLHWHTSISKANLGVNVWAGGIAFVVPEGGLPGGIGPITWTASFATDTPKLEARWQWSAAVYTRFGWDLNDVGVKAVDGPKENTFEDATKAGTPWYWLDYVTGGARGGGGSNYTGSWSGTGSVALCVE